MMSHYMNKKNNLLKNYDVIGLGYNFRLTDFQAALGTSQLKKIDKYQKKRIGVVKDYIKNLSSKYYEFYGQNIKNYSWHLFIIKLKKNYEKKKVKLVRHLKKNKIETRFHYIPNHLHTFYKNNKNVFFDKKNLQNSLNYYKSSLSIPIHPDLKKNEVKKIIRILNTFFS